MIDLVETNVTISIGLFILLVGLAWVGLMISGGALYIAIVSFWQRGEMLREVKKYNELLDKPDEPELTTSITSPVIQWGHPDVIGDVLDKEFLEDRD